MHPDPAPTNLVAEKSEDVNFEQFQKASKSIVLSFCEYSTETSSVHPSANLLGIVVTLFERRMVFK